MNKIPSQAIHRRVSLKFKQDKAMTDLAERNASWTTGPTGPG